MSTEPDPRPEQSRKNFLELAWAIAERVDLSEAEAEALVAEAVAWVRGAAPQR